METPLSYPFVSEKTMADALPKWADGDLSNELPHLRERGEGQELEFKGEFPPQAHDLAEVVAAFASSGGGRILVGVADDGTLSNLPAEDATARDKLVGRAQGIVRSVRPDVTANYSLALEQGQTVLCIRIPKQDEPVYYYDGRPYVRDDRISRRATPEEVKTLVWKHPSSEYRRRQEEMALRREELTVKQVEGLVEQSRLSGERSDELRRLANQQMFGRS
jgi:predicted HTH transcriptional regulator